MNAQVDTIENPSPAGRGRPQGGADGHHLADDETWRSNSASPRSARELSKELWTYRSLLLLMTKRNITERTKQSFLGLLWPLFQPIFNAVLFVLVFNRLAGIEAEGSSYLLFAYIGASVWTFTNSSVNMAVPSITIWNDLVTKLYLPRIAIPLSAIASNGLGLGISLLMAVPIMLLERQPLGWAALTLPLWLLGLAMLVAGLSGALSAAQVRYRDTARLVVFLSQAWLYLSPVAYPASLIENEVVAVLYRLNPLAGILGGIRWAVAGGPWDVLNVGSTLLTIPILVLGTVVFARLERSIADHI